MGSLLHHGLPTHPYSTAQVLATLHLRDKFTEVDLELHFYQLQLQQSHQKFYSMLFHHQKLHLMHLVMSHHFTPTSMQQ
jgi:hypothetical protein